MKTELPQLRLPDDPRAALREIAKFLNSIQMNAENRVPAGVRPSCSFGYALSHSFIYDLLEMASEAQRIGNLP